MRTLLTSSLFVIGLAGSLFAMAAGTRVLEPSAQNRTVFVADQPIPDPHSDKCPKVAMDQPIPDPHSDKCPKVAMDQPIPDPHSDKCPKLVG